MHALSLRAALPIITLFATTAWGADTLRPAPQGLARWVNPFVGTGGMTWLCGNNYPGPSLPFGLMRLSPETVSRSGQRAMNTSGYYYGDSRLVGFNHTRLNGTGAVDGGHFLVVPLPRDVPAERPVVIPFDHDSETAFPGYYALRLNDPKVLVELTATERVGLHRYTFDDGPPRLRLVVTHALGKGRASEGELHVSSDRRELTGAARTFGSFSGRYGGLKLYFAARFDHPPAEVVLSEGVWQIDGRATGTDDQGLVADLHFAQGDPRQVVLRLAISCVSIENARANLDAEAGDDTFSEVLCRAQQTWNEWLGRIEIDGSTDAERTNFYTGLYRSFQMPTRFGDVDGRYLGFDKEVHQADDFDYYTDLSLWDTFRTTHPLYMLIAPREQRDMVVSMVEMCRQGGWLPRWPSGNGYTNSMLGTPADIMIAETYLKGIRDFDVETAFRAMLETARRETPAGAAFSGRRGVDQYVRLGYCPAGMAESVSRTLEYAHADFAIANLAEALGYDDEAAEFRARAQNYRNLWNPQTQHFHPRDADGKFVEAFRPRLLTYLDFGGRFTRDYVEGSATQWRWSVPFDPQGLIELFGGAEPFVRELEAFMQGAPAGVGALPTPDYWHGNQPDIHAAYLFNDAGRPDLAQKWVRWILATKYRPTPDGLDGNDDGGTMSAWYVLSALGIYPVTGTDRYHLAAPLFERAVLSLGPERKLVIETENYAPEHVEVERVWLNDEPLDRFWLRHGEIAEGGVLRFRMRPATSVHSEAASE